MPLAVDEVQCQWCHNIFISPEAYEAHHPKRVGGCWGASKMLCGLILNERTGRWGFDAKDASRRPRKSQAQAAFERVNQRVSPPRAKAAREQYDADVAKIEAALKKARDA